MGNPRSVTSALSAGAFLLSVACGGSGDARQLDDLVREARQLDLDGQHEEAVALYRQALDREPASFDAHYGIGRALDLAGRYAEARRHFAHAIELAPEPRRDQALRMMAIAWTFAGDGRQASDYFRQVFDRRGAAGNFPGAAEVANELGRVYLELGDLDQAESWYRTGHRTAALQSDRPQPAIDLADLRWAHAQARIAARRGQPDEARRHAAIVSELLDRGGNDDQRVHQPYLLGYIDFHLGDYASAIRHLENADQEDPFILYLLAEAHAQQGDRDAARAYYAKVLESASHGVTAAMARPVAREKLGRE